MLFIDFDHIISANKQLAFTLCNSDDQWRNAWLTRAAGKFFEINGLPVENIKVHIMNMPDSIADAEDVLNSNTLVKKRSLFCGEDAHLPTVHGSLLFDLILCGLLEKLEKGETWCGGLSLKDLVIACYPGGKLRLFITRNPFMKRNASNEDKALDVASIWPMLERIYISDDGVLPLFFDDLREDLLTVTADEIGQGWFIEYLKFHVALSSSMARRLLVTETFHNVRKFNINQWSEFKDFFYEEPMSVDWREIAKAYKPLQVIYHFKENQEKRRSGKERSEKGEGKQHGNENFQVAGEKCGISKETSYEGKAGIEGEQDEREGTVAESQEKGAVVEGKSESGKEQSQRRKKKVQRDENSQEAGEKCGLLKETSQEGKAATECKQAEREEVAIAESEEKEAAIKGKCESWKVQSKSEK